MGSLFFEGLLLQAGLIFALGSQNIFVLESGMRRQNHLVVSFVCFFCDLCLILLGVAGAATLFTQYPFLKILVGVLGASFLFAYGVIKIFSHQEQSKLEHSKLDFTLKRSILLSISFSLLNPHAYLDAFILIGGFSTKYADLQDRVVLGLGAAFYSGLWFLLLSSLSSVMKPILEHPGRMRFVMTAAGFILIFLSGKQGLDVLDWINHGLDPFFVLGEWVFYPPPPGVHFTSILY